MGEIVKSHPGRAGNRITKPKLLTFHWFAWMYSHWETVLDGFASGMAVYRPITFARVRQMKADLDAR